MERGEFHWQPPIKCNYNIGIVIGCVLDQNRPLKLSFVLLSKTCISSHNFIELNKKWTQNQKLGWFLQAERSGVEIEQYLCGYQALFCYHCHSWNTSLKCVVFFFYSWTLYPKWKKIPFCVMTFVQPVSWPKATSSSWDLPLEVKSLIYTKSPLQCSAQLWPSVCLNFMVHRNLSWTLKYTVAISCLYSN